MRFEDVSFFTMLLHMFNNVLNIQGASLMNLETSVSPVFDFVKIRFEASIFLTSWTSLNIAPEIYDQSSDSHSASAEFACRQPVKYLQRKILCHRPILRIRYEILHFIRIISQIHNPADAFIHTQQGFKVFSIKRFKIYLTIKPMAS